MLQSYNNSSPILSIIMPLYNVDKTLRLLVIKAKKVIFMFNLNKRKHYEKKLTAIKNQIDELVKIIAYSENIK